jgi:Na+/melibiose symporter-like transporter
MVTMMSSGPEARAQHRSRLSQLVAMVAGNRPWRMVLGMRSALAAVLATSAYLVITSTVWQLASALSWTKLVVTMGAAVVMMVVWIIGAHDLWRRPSQVSQDDDPAVLNASTVLTLLLGVLTMAVAVFAFNIVATFYFLEPPVFGTDAWTAQGASDHVRLAWLSTAFATVAGALGSGLDSDAAVEASTYSDDERRRRERSSVDDGDRDGSSSSDPAERAR